VRIEQALEEASKCAFCGFCEFACPTYRALRVRHMGPRGRVTIARLLDGRLTSTAAASIMTCLACGACEARCPLGLKIASILRAAKARVTALLAGTT